MDTGLPSKTLPREAIEGMDVELFRLGRGAGIERLRLGEVLEAFAVRGGHHACGFSSFADYVRERCGRSGRWGSESRVVARRLAGLPRLRRALADGVLGWSMVELLSRRARPEDEEAMVERARRATVRQMREALAQVDAEDAADVLEQEEESTARTLSVTVSAVDAWTFEATRILIEHLEGGHATTERVLEAMLAEGELALQTLVDPELREASDTLDQERQLRAAWLQQRARWRVEAEARCESRIPRAAPVQQRDSGDDHGGGEELPADPVMLDALIQELARAMSERDLQLGALARELFEADGWRRLGYASASQYARERLGLSHSALKGHITMSRRIGHRPAVQRALRDGRIGMHAAGLVARVSNLSNTEAWVQRAEARTVKHLQEEVQAAELVRRVLRLREAAPPDAETLEAVTDLQRQIVGGRLFREAFAEDGQMSADHATGVAIDTSVDTSIGSAIEEAGKRTLHLRVSEDTYLMYRALEHDYLHRTCGSASFLAFLCWSVWHSWHGSLGTDVAYGGIYVRDLFRCTSPVCSRRDVTPHHLRFRSQGGGDEAENVTSLCVFCHLEGVHGGRIGASPPASNVHWSLGEHPVLRVQGRTKLGSGRLAWAQVC